MISTPAISPIFPARIASLARWACFPDPQDDELARGPQKKFEV
jgi:hypothetical protein